MNTLQTLVVARHGDFYGDGSLGSDQIRKLADSLRPFLEGKQVAVLSSSTDRAKRSAKILCEQLDLPPAEIDSVLYPSGDYLDEDEVAKTMGLIRSRAEQYEAVVLVTHAEYTGEFPIHFAKEWKSAKVVYKADPDKGQAVVIDCSTMRMVLLPSGQEVCNVVS